MRPARIIAIAAAALVVLGAPAAYTAYWFALGGQVELGIQRWETDRRAEGYVIKHGPMQRGGFPFALSFTIPQPEIARPDPPLAWRAETLTVSAKPWALQDVSFRFPGRHELAGPVDGKPRLIDAAIGDGQLDVLFDGRGRALAAQLDLKQVEAKFADTGELFRIAAARSVMRRRAMTAVTDVSLETDTKITGLVLPAAQAGPLGPEIAAINALANVIGQAPENGTREAAARWRDAGGYIEIKEAQLVWNRVDIRGTGTARLDATLQPDIRLDGRVRGVDTLIDALVATGQMRVPESILAKGVLAGLSRPADDGGPPVLRVPISVREGNRVYLGPVRVGRMQPLVWR